MEWSGLIKQAAAAVLFGLFMTWLARSRLATPSQRSTLVLPSSVLILGVVTTLFCWGLAVASTTFAKNESSSVWVAVFFGVFGLLGLYFALAYWRDRHGLSARGIAYGKTFGAAGQLAWTDVDQVSWGAGARWFVIKGMDGTKVHISAMLLGLPDFAEHVLTHVPHTRIDQDAREVLQQIQEGNLPPLS